MTTKQNTGRTSTLKNEHAQCNKTKKGLLKKYLIGQKGGREENLTPSILSKVVTVLSKKTIRY